MQRVRLASGWCAVLPAFAAGFARRLCGTADKLARRAPGTCRQERPPDAAMSQTVARSQTASEELANALSHGLGAVLAALFSPQLIARALDAGAVHAVAAALFCGSMILLFAVSAVYHWV